LNSLQKLDESWLGFIVVDQKAPGQGHS